jgi:hypothetical protein
MAPILTQRDEVRLITHFARTDPRVRERLANVRSRVVTVDCREDGPGEVGFYDYDNDVLVVAVVDPFAAELVDLVERRVSPPITLEELAEVLELLTRRTSNLQAALTRRRARTAAFTTPTYGFVDGSGREGHRGCVLYVESKGSVLHGVVDLSARQVVPDRELDESLRGGRQGRPLR